jgi:hypothetical protein
LGFSHSFRKFLEFRKFPQFRQIQMFQRFPGFLMNLTYLKFQQIQMWPLLTIKSTPDLDMMNNLHFLQMCL